MIELRLSGSTPAVCRSRLANFFRSNLVLVLCIIAMMTVVRPVLAIADVWSLPVKQTYYSANHRIRLVVIPRGISSQLSYFGDKIRNKRDAGQSSGNRVPYGILEGLTDKGQWGVIWRKPLANDVSPVSALVGNSGRYVATFDNWHSVGEGENVVVIYGPKGSVIQSFALKDFLPDYYIYALPHSVSSIWWGGTHALSSDGQTLVLSVVVPSEKAGRSASVYANLVVELATGHIQPPTNKAWKKALDQASLVATEQRAAALAWTAKQIAPLLGPKTTDEGEWHWYLTEAFFRSDDEWKENYPANFVLRAPTARDYHPSEVWLHDALLEKEMQADIIMIASPASPENLISVLTAITRKMRSNALSNARIYVAAPIQFRNRIASALAPTGATFIFLDPTKPIPQRRERLPVQGGGALKP